MSKAFENPKIYGMVTVNTKWQVVIPSEVRSLLNIHEGDQFIVISGDQYWLWLIKADTLQDFILSAQKAHPEAFEHIEALKTYTS